MKRIICIVLIACLVPACSFAIDLKEFNTNAMVFDMEAIDETTAVVSGRFTTFSVGDCKFGFEEKENQISRIIVQGKGEPFLAYAMASIMTFDDNSDAFVENAGKLLAAFLLVESDDTQYSRISSGQLFLIKKIGDEYYFTIGR